MVRKLQGVFVVNVGCEFRSGTVTKNKSGDSVRVVSDLASVQDTG